MHRNALKIQGENDNNEHTINEGQTMHYAGRKVTIHGFMLMSR